LSSYPSQEQAHLMPLYGTQGHFMPHFTATLSPKSQNLPSPSQAIHAHAFDNWFGAGETAVLESI
jgi:hypothetical protein